MLLFMFKYFFSLVCFFIELYLFKLMVNLTLVFVWLDCKIVLIDGFLLEEYYNLVIVSAS